MTRKLKTEYHVYVRNVLVQYSYITSINSKKLKKEYEVETYKHIVVESGFNPEMQTPITVRYQHSTPLTAVLTPMIIVEV